MNIWREAAGAWRSLRFDLRLRANRRDATEVLPTVDDDPDPGYPAGTGTPPGGGRAGRSGGTRQDAPSPYDAFARRPRRAPAALTVAVLVVAGAAGTYFAVVGGLSVLMTGEAPPPGALPAVSRDAAPAVRPPLAPRRSPAAPRSAAPPSAAPATAAATAAAPDPAPTAPPPAPRPPEVGRPSRGVPVPTPAPPCGCPYPPPPPPSASPSPAPSPSPSPSPAPTPTAEPTEAPPGDPGS